MTFLQLQPTDPDVVSVMIALNKEKGSDLFFGDVKVSDLQDNQIRAGQTIHVRPASYEPWTAR